MDLYMRWIVLAGVWLISEVVGYYGLSHLGWWRRWMGWITPLLLGGTVIIFLLSRWLPISLEGYKKLTAFGGILFLLWIALLLGKLVGGAWGIFVGQAVRHRSENFSAGRRATLQAVGGIITSLPALSLGYGYWIGRYRFRVEFVEVPLVELPPAWEGTTILHFSDLHSGSFFSPAVLHPVWEKVEHLRPDLIAFSGDWVNTFAAELEPFVADLARLTAPLGKWAVLGNHDYGDYIAGATPQRKAHERTLLRQLIKEAGFRLLEDEVAVLEKDKEMLALVGVGNWSRWRRFQRYGDLAKAWALVPPNTCALLLSHDPTHWEYEVQGHYPIALTLSGHTHGLQVGVEWLHWRFSPAQWLYTYWAGLYRVGKQYLYVNRGLGYIGLPARIGIWPEITFLRLVRASDSV